MKKKKEFSKKLCNFSLTLFCIMCFIGIILTFLEVENQVIITLISSSGLLVASSFAFYFNKAKAENLVKLKLRNVLLKLRLEERISDEDVFEITEELDQLNMTIDNKINEMYENTINEETEINM